MSSVINATVKYQAREVETKYGKRINVVLLSDNGEKIVRWGNPDDSNLTALKRNQKVTLVRDSNNKITIIPVSESSEHTISDNSKPENWNNEIKKVLQDKALKLISFYEECDKLVRDTIKDYRSEESLRSITTTVFLQSVRNM